jgi:hypothetical protein
MGEREDARPALDTAVEGIPRRDLLRGAAALGAGAVATGMTVGPAVAAPRRGHHGRGPRALRVLQPGEGPGRVGTYIRSTPETVHWGQLPNAVTRPVATVPSGAVVTFDTVSHEGILEDQGRDPVAFFARSAFRGAACCATPSQSPARASSTTSRTTART